MSYRVGLGKRVTVLWFPSQNSRHFRSFRVGLSDAWYDHEGPAAAMTKEKPYWIWIEVRVLYRTLVRVYISKPSVVYMLMQYVLSSIDDL